jgi:choline-sulfatase
MWQSLRVVSDSADVRVIGSALPSPAVRQARLLFLLIVVVAACARREAHPPIILISIDTLRADHIDPARTPNITALRRDSVDFRNAWSHSPLTLPSHLSIFTGALPPEHGVRDNGGYRFDATAHPTIASLLKQNGYRTGAAVSAYVLRRESGAASGFDDYDDAIGIVDGAPSGALQRRGDVTEKIAEEWIASHDTQPFFYFLHLYEPHTPYTPTYDADVTRADAITGRFLDFLRKRGLYDRALIVLVSDHGEGLMDHGEQEHGILLYREALQVPLIVKTPHAREKRIDDAPAQLIDVMPTILAAAGISSPPSRGTSLLGARAPHPIYSESLYARIHLGCSELRSIVDRRRHVIDGMHSEVFDLARDRAEKNNVIAHERRALAGARETIATIGGAFAKPEAIAPEEAKKLAALGYVSAGPDEGSLRDTRECVADFARLKEIAELRRQGREREAVARMETLLAANPQWSDVRDQLASAYDDAGDHLRAAAIYEEGIRVTPRLAGGFALSAAASLLDAGKLDEAAAHAAAAIENEPAAAHLLLGEIALARHDEARAKREEAEAEHFPNERGHALFLSARIAANERDYAHTVSLLRDSDAARRRTGESLPRGFHYVAGDALAHLGRLPDAEREMELEIASEPHDVQTYADLALMRIMRGDRAAAFATLERMIDAKPDSDTIRFAADSLDRWGEHAAATKWRKRQSEGRRVNTRVVN